MDTDGRGGAGPNWVEDLSGPEDYWLTLTDAARVTRRQEVTIRRWVAAGSLPIRSRTLGLNKRTRHVRASDLSQLTPIVDPSATISGATAQIDLLAIPTQQANILQRHREIDQRLQTLVAEVEKSTSSQHAQLSEHHTQIEQIERAAQELQTELASSRQQAEEHHTTLGRELSGLQQKVKHLSTDAKQVKELRQELQAGEERAVKRQAEQEEVQRGLLARLERLEERGGRIEQQVTTNAKDRTKQQRQIDAVAEEASSLDKRLRQVDERLTGEIGEQKRAQQETDQQINQLGAALTKLRQDTQKQAAENKRQAIEIGKQLQALQRAMEESRTRSQKVQDQLTRQKAQLEKLTQQVTIVTAQIPHVTQTGEPGSKPVRQRRARRPKLAPTKP